MDLLSPEVAEQIFNECDITKKGVLTVDDFRNLSELTDGQFSDTETAFIFEQLDINRDGVVTKEEFVNGFARALNLGETKRRDSLLSPRTNQSPRASPLGHRADHTDGQQNITKHNSEIDYDYGKLDVLPCQEELLALYGRLQCLNKSDQQKSSIPDLLAQFEKFVDGVCKELTDQRDQNDRLRDMLTKEKVRHDQQIDEVETNLTSTVMEAREKAKREERERFEYEKEQICQQFETELAELKSTIATLQKSVFDEENAKYEKSEEVRQRLQELTKENMRLRHHLTEKQTEMVLVQAAMARLRQNFDDKLSDWTAEKEQLVSFGENMNKQMQLLYEANKQLQDTNDHLRCALEARMASSRHTSARTPSPVCPPSRQISEMQSQGTNLLNVKRPVSAWLKRADESMETDEECDTSFIADSAPEDDLHRRLGYGQSDRDEASRNISVSSIVRTDSMSSNGTAPTYHSKCSIRVNPSTDPTGPPDRTFRVVTVGDASVGKTTLIMRIVKGEFRQHLTATIGVEYQSKCLRVDGRNVALQLWDTAGQEKFRSLCKTFFRRADGAILAYDATCEQSFLNVRYWLDTLQESVDRKIPVLLCANKIDLRLSAATRGQRYVSREDGEKLAKSHSIMFIETSAKDGTNVLEAAISLTRELLAAEDTTVRRSCVVLEEKKKSGCRTCRGS